MNTLTLPTAISTDHLNARPANRSNHPITPRRPQRVAEPCRMATVLMDQHSGTPFFPELHAEYENYLPAEQALLGVGLAAQSGAFARVALYAFSNQGPRLVLHADLDMEGSGGGILRTDRGERFRHIPASKLAALNWTLGALLSGGSSDHGRHLGAFDLTPERLAELIDRPIPRKDWALERSAEACAAMFARFCVALPQNEGLDRTVRLPDVLPLLSGDVDPLYSISRTHGEDPRSVDAAFAALPVNRFTLSPAAFRSYAVNRFALGLRRADGHSADSFRETKRRFARHFEIAQELFDQRNVPAQLSHLGRAVASSKKESLAHLAVLRLPEDQQRESVAALAMAINSLRTFARQRDTEGRVVMYAPGRPVAPEADRTPEDLSTKQAELFARPMFRGISGYPCQSVDVLSTGAFPVDGADLASLPTV